MFGIKRSFIVWVKLKQKKKPHPTELLTFTDRVFQQLLFLFQNFTERVGQLVWKSAFTILILHKECVFLYVGFCLLALHLPLIAHGNC